MLQDEINDKNKTIKSYKEKINENNELILKIDSIVDRTFLAVSNE